MNTTYSGVYDKTTIVMLLALPRVFVYLPELRETTGAVSMVTVQKSTSEQNASDLLYDCNLEESRQAWLNLASEDTLHRLWDTPEEDEAWRDLLEAT